ncbi:sensor histidine kinase [Micromonospora sonneratiae]|uniref:histidine kinase n=1 Tax=Micromonospora sonneratiae TaxID=1184706 RepID=A0ABW3YLZ6_9ACTN
MRSIWQVAHRVLRAPVTRRAWAELAYVVAGFPLTCLGVAYVLTGAFLSAGLAITALGVPLLALLVPGARGLARVRLGMARTLLGENIASPAPFRPGPGFFTRIRGGLRDTTGWRAVGYLLAALPVSLLSLWVVIVTWAWGLVALTYPIQHMLGVNQMTIVDADGVTRTGFILGSLVLDTWPELLVVSAGGALLLLLAPWAVRAVVLLDRLLIRSLLGPDRSTQRIADLRRTRAHAVDDAAATLRRIERDLHDGVQARLVALGMNLTMVSETLGDDTSETTRALLAAARDNAKSAITELRDVVRGIHPPVLDSGIDAAIATLAARSPIPVDLRTDITTRPTAAIETIAYFCVAELLTNIAKHSGASRATVDVTQPGGRLHLRISDNGKGGATLSSAKLGSAKLGSASLDGGTGLRGLVDRVATVDGTLNLVSPPAGPTVVTIDLPLHT